MITLSLVSSLVVLYSYLIWVAIRNGGFPISLSETYYILQKEKKGWMFQLVLATSSLLILPTWISVTPESYKFLAFLSVASTLFVSAAPKFMESLESSVHYVSAVIACVTACIWCILQPEAMYTLPLLVIAIAFTIKTPRSWGLYVELLMLTSVVVILFFK